ncbi:MAG TPA: cytoplasmic protein, partial [Candidatus Saccharicenans sp.]|nr:cytoplasmic protein [Candidatus Saccharicenans sp.]
MERREFIKELVIGGVAIGLSPHLLAQSSYPELAVVTGESPEKITRGAVELLGGMKRFIGRGDKVIIKPNIG